MKDTIRCSECSSAAWKPHVGFCGTDELVCSDRSGTVDPDDGCTFGSRGAPRVAVSEYEVDIGNRAAVNGW